MRPAPTVSQGRRDRRGDIVDDEQLLGCRTQLIHGTVPFFGMMRIDALVLILSLIFDTGLANDKMPISSSSLASARVHESSTNSLSVRFYS